MKHLKNFNEEFSEDNSRIRVGKSIPRPEQPINKLSDKELDDMRRDMENAQNDRERRVDPYFIQEITDRILGPDSKAYIEEIKELNKKYRSRPGKTGVDIFKK
jgi:hypothetical protein